MNQLARRFRWKCWFMTWKEELGFLQYLPDIPAHLSLPSSFGRCSHSTTIPPQVSAVGWTQHHFADFRGEVPYKWLWVLEAPWNQRACAQEEFVPYFFLFAGGWMFKSIMSPLHSTLWRHTLWHRGILAVEKKKLQKHFTEPWNVPKYIRR